MDTNLLPELTFFIVRTNSSYDNKVCMAELNNGTGQVQASSQKSLEGVQQDLIDSLHDCCASTPKDQQVNPNAVIEFKTVEQRVSVFKTEEQDDPNYPFMFKFTVEYL